MKKSQKNKKKNNGLVANQPRLVDSTNLIIRFTPKIVGFQQYFRHSGV